MNMSIKSLVILAVILLFLVACSKGKITGGVVTDTTTKDVKLQVSGCQDSDEGKVAKNRGVVKIVQDGRTSQKMDECFNGILVEYYCDKAGIKSENVNCASSGKKCYAGACN